MTGQESSFRELSEARCRELLADHTVGRVAWNAPGCPQVLPVSYAIDGNDIVFRTSPYGSLAQLRSRSNVAFEIDDIDTEHGTGWSVLVRGSAQATSQSRHLERLWSSEAAVPWAAGSRNLVIAITPQTLTGRVVRRPWSSADPDT